MPWGWEGGSVEVLPHSQARYSFKESNSPQSIGLCAPSVCTSCWASSQRQSKTPQQDVVRERKWLSFQTRTGRGVTLRPSPQCGNPSVLQEHTGYKPVGKSPCWRNRKGLSLPQAAGTFLCHVPTGS